MVMGSLSSCDPGNIFNTIDVRKGVNKRLLASTYNTMGVAMIFQELVKQSVRCSVVGLAAEVRLCKTISQKTGGMYMYMHAD